MSDVVMEAMSLLMMEPHLLSNEVYISLVILFFQ